MDRYEHKRGNYKGIKGFFSVGFDIPHLVRWVMVVFLLFCGVPQKTVAAITNYTDRQVRNIRDRFENSNGDFSREGKKRGRKKKIKSGCSVG